MPDDQQPDNQDNDVTPTETPSISEETTTSPTSDVSDESSAETSTSEPSPEPSVTPPASVVSPEPASTSSTVSTASSKPGKKKLGLLGGIVAIIVLLAGGSAAAYYGVIAPNKPENVLKTAAQKLLEQHQITTKGNVSVDMNAKDASLKNVTVTFTSSADSDKQAFDINLNASASGVQLPLELLSVDNNIYFKVGDLGSIKGIAALSDPAAGAIVDSIGSKLSNQWVEVDQSLLKQANASCTTSVFNSFSKQDVDQIMNLYSNNQFVIIKSKTADKVDGQAATRYELGLDKQKAAAFASKLNSVQALKKISDCAGAATNQTAATGDTEVTNAANSSAAVSLEVWVDSSKTVRQIQVKVNDKDTTATAVITYTNGKVNIQKPANAKPLLQVVGDFSSLFGADATTAPDQTLPSTSDDPATQACLQQYENYANSGGTGPIPTCQ